MLAVIAASCSLQNVGCRMPEELAPQADASAPAASTGDPGNPAPRGFTIVFLGDSLTAGSGLLSQQAFPALVEDLFAAEGYSVEAINAGISGDTSAGGLRRVEPLLSEDARVLVLALGANDALRGLTVAETRDNLSGIIRAAQARGVAVVLCGMEAPTNYGEDYREAFRQVFLRLGLDFGDRITFVPFLLEGVAGRPELNQADGVHPNERGARTIAEMLYPRLRTVVDSLGGGG
jgi:acyl-CoA thioesterase-1